MPSFFKSTVVKPAASTVSNEIMANTNLQRELGFFQGRKVKKAEDLAKGKGMITITEKGVEAMVDVVCTDIDAQRSLLKAGIAARAVPKYAAMATELQARAAVSHEQFTNINEEGHLGVLKGRYAFNQEISAMMASGMISREEAEEMLAHRHDLAVQDIARLDKNVTRAKDALDDMVARATDHITAPAGK